MNEPTKEEVIEYWQNTWKEYSFHPMATAPSQKKFLATVEATVKLLGGVIK